MLSTTLRWSPWIGIFIFSLFVQHRVVADPCLAATSCTECIKTHKDCAWCIDPNHNSSTRCGHKSELINKCAQGQIYVPITELKLPKQHNLKIGYKHPDGVTVTQLEPQQIQVRIKPGDSVELPFRYEHHAKPGLEVRDFQIMTSSVRDTGVEIEFSIDCNGERKGGTTCPGVTDGQRVNFYAKITLNDCKEVAMSVSVYGYNTVSAIFITPLCSCECESPRAHERRSPTCRYQGDLVCGSCRCEPGKGGRTCECNLHEHGVSSALELDDKCRERPGAALCSGQGSCQCGKCQCDNSIVQGSFCECDSTKCPLDSNGQLCSGQGECLCGKCQCQDGFTGPDCSCRDDPEPCTENGLVCNGNGACECGRCACNVGFTGATCSIEENLEDDVVRALPRDEDSRGQTISDETTGEPDSASSFGSVFALLSLILAAQLA